MRTDLFDLGGLRLTAGEGRRLEFAVAIESFELSDDTYAVQPSLIPVTLDVSRMTGQGYALRLRFGATLIGSCMRCLEPAELEIPVDAREIDQPGAEDPELESPYVTDQVLDVAAWARDALALTLPTAVLCRPDCAGLCPICGTDLNAAGPDHHHDSGPDPRWSKLSEIRFDS